MAKFIDNYKTDVSGVTEQKNKLNYISWANAQKMAMEHDENFTWQLIPTSEGALLHNGLVLVEMTFLGRTYKHYFPVLDYRNKAITNPNAFDINTAQMRGMTKLFSMISGYGLSLYTGEDINNLDNVGKESEEEQEKNEVIKSFDTHCKQIAQQNNVIKNKAVSELFESSGINTEGKFDREKLKQMKLIDLKLMTVELGKINTREIEDID